MSNDKGSRYEFHYKNSYKHVSICSKFSEKSFQKFQNYFFLQCRDLKSDTAFDQIILYVDNERNMDDQGFINPDQIFEPSSIDLPESIVLGLYEEKGKQYLVASNPHSFIVQYDL
jgi:hypothetical protein